MDPPLAALSGFLDSAGLLWGCADVQGLFPAFSEYPRALSLAWPLPAGDLAGLEDGPTESYYAAYGAANALLNSISIQAAENLERAGFKSLAFPATVSQQQLENMSGGAYQARLAHKTVATRAGLGWIGK
ncbi:MAG: hypothetical protein ACYC6L_11545, partial [Anaerolineae bacterium]